MKRRAWSAGAATVAAVAGLVACDALLGLHDPGSTSTDAGEDRVAGEAASTVPDSTTGFPEAGCLPEQTLCGEQCVDLSTDPSHCGACDHGCFLPSCAAGLCGPAEIVLPVSEPVRGIASNGAALYAMTDDGVFATGAGGDDLMLPPFFPMYVLDGGVARSLAAFPAVAVAPGDTLLSLTSPSQVLAADAGDPLSLASHGTALYWASSDPSATAIMTFQPPGPPSTFVTLQPGDRPCALSASPDGLFWSSARGTFMVPFSGGSPVAVTSTPFDNAVALLGGGATLVADSYGGVTLLRPESPPEVIAVPGAVNAIVVGLNSIFLAGDGIYMLDLPEDGGAPVVTLLASGGVPSGCHAPVFTQFDNFIVWVDAASGTVKYLD